MSISTKNKTAIDTFLNEFKLKTINFIYGGQTSRPIEEREKEHLKDKKFFKMSIVEITNCTTKSPKQAKLIETYLINKLNELYSTKCINDKNNDGALAQRGGAGESFSQIKHKFYIMYK